MAECLALQAQAGGAGGRAPAELRARRAGLEGPRAVAFGETETAPGAAAPQLELDVVGPATADELELDGVLKSPAERRVTLTLGLHHVRVLRHGRLVFAAFQEVAAEQKTLELAVPKLVPCSYDDLGGVDRGLLAQGVPPPPGVTCDNWALARSEPAGVGIALCHRASCGPFVHWQRRPKPAAFTPLAVDRSRLPVWAGFAIAGASAALATGLVLWQSGALDRGQRASATLEYGGLNP